MNPSFEKRGYVNFSIVHTKYLDGFLFLRETLFLVVKCVTWEEVVWLFHECDCVILILFLSCFCLECQKDFPASKFPP